METWDAGRNLIKDFKWVVSRIMEPWESVTGWNLIEGVQVFVLYVVMDYWEYSTGGGVWLRGSAGLQ